MLVDIVLCSKSPMLNITGEPPLLPEPIVFPPNSALSSFSLNIVPAHDCPTDHQVKSMV